MAFGQFQRKRRNRAKIYRVADENGFKEVLSLRRTPEKWINAIRSLPDEELRNYVEFYFQGRTITARELEYRDPELAKEVKKRIEKRGAHFPNIEGEFSERIRQPHADFDPNRRMGPVLWENFASHLDSIRRPSQEELPKYSLMSDRDLVEEAAKIVKGMEISIYALPSAIIEKDRELYSYLKKVRNWQSRVLKKAKESV